LLLCFFRNEGLGQAAGGDGFGDGAGDGPGGGAGGVVDVGVGKATCDPPSTKCVVKGVLRACCPADYSCKTVGPDVVCHIAEKDKKKCKGSFKSCRLVNACCASGEAKCIALGTLGVCKPASCPTARCGAAGFCCKSNEICRDVKVKVGFFSKTIRACVANSCPPSPPPAGEVNKVVECRGAQNLMVCCEPGKCLSSTAGNPTCTDTWPLP